MAHKKGASSSRNGRDSNAQRLGVKRFGGQAVGAGVLRGIGDTRAPLISMVAGYWLLGLPISVWLGFRTGLREVGLWYGFVVSLGVVALFLLLRIRVLFGRELRRIELVGWSMDRSSPSASERASDASSR